MMRAKRFTATELDIHDFVEYAKAHVGEKHALEFQDYKKGDQIAGYFEILDFEQDSNPEFVFHHWRSEEENTPDGARVGCYRVRLTGTKFYNGKTFTVPVTAYVQHERAGYVFKTKALFVSNVPNETGKRMKAYSFGILDFNARA